MKKNILVVCAFFVSLFVASCSPRLVVLPPPS